MYSISLPDLYTYSIFAKFYGISIPGGVNSASTSNNVLDNSLFVVIARQVFWFITFTNKEKLFNYLKNNERVYNLNCGEVQVKIWLKRNHLQSQSCLQYPQKYYILYLNKMKKKVNYDFCIILNIFLKRKYMQNSRNPQSSPIPTHIFALSKKKKIEKQIDNLELLTKKLSLPSSVLTGLFGQDLRLIEEAILITEDDKTSTINI